MISCESHTIASHLSLQMCPSDRGRGHFLFAFCVCVKWVLEWKHLSELTMFSLSWLVRRPKFFLSRSVLILIEFLHPQFLCMSISSFTIRRTNRTRMEAMLHIILFMKASITETSAIYKGAFQFQTHRLNYRAVYWPIVGCRKTLKLCNAWCESVVQPFWSSAAVFPVCGTIVLPRNKTRQEPARISSDTTQNAASNVFKRFFAEHGNVCFPENCDDIMIVFDIFQAAQTSLCKAKVPSPKAQQYPNIAFKNKSKRSQFRNITLRDIQKL